MTIDLVFKKYYFRHLSARLSVYYSLQSITEIMFSFSDDQHFDLIKIFLFTVLIRVLN